MIIFSMAELRFKMCISKLIITISKSIVYGTNDTNSNLTNRIIIITKYYMHRMKFTNRNLHVIILSLKRISMDKLEVETIFFWRTADIRDITLRGLIFTITCLPTDYNWYNFSKRLSYRLNTLTWHLMNASLGWCLSPELSSGR